MRTVRRMLFTTVAMIGLMGITTGMGNAASSNLETQRLGSGRAAGGSVESYGSSTRLPSGLGAHTTIRQDFTVERVGPDMGTGGTMGTGAGGTMERGTGGTMDRGTGGTLDKEPGGTIDKGTGGGYYDQGTGGTGGTMGTGNMGTGGTGVGTGGTTGTGTGGTGGSMGTGETGTGAGGW